ncbi:acyltransferase [Anaerocolumna sp. AGMB13020]|uniref:acyltransferase n=1 Tax=Anaerocolumna sp. AGMB13020 TaxID=3081750 RepID=UPI0029544114|nr:acyltransferase [Anaerocolumna sp. AGMB13020]WOO37577.1 acyltransferase [Anaerocolumna sp. AGMB13020]
MKNELSDTKKAYPDIDVFRIVAAILVVAIHTSPLTSYNGYADFLLTRVVGRVAVPFFFMVTGFFLYDEVIIQRNKLNAFLKKTSLYYMGAILLYLPINWYSGYFNSEKLGSKIIRDVLLDGTMYHLWYLPAAVIGSIIAYYALKYLSLQGAFALTFVLYLLGMLGDSYYGLTKSIPALNGLYNNLFQVMDYTRNGIFFAPVFFVLGAMSKKRRCEFKKSLIFTVVCLLLMALEGTILKSNNLMRHDSMYLLLVPLMYFLFSMLLQRRGTQKRGFRDISLIIYIIHPLIIILIRGASKIAGIERWTVYNSLLHFLLTAIFSFLAGLVITNVLQKLRLKSST